MKVDSVLWILCITAFAIIFHNCWRILQLQKSAIETELFWMQKQVRLKSLIRNKRNADGQSNQDDKESVGGGAPYVRWGRSNCDNQAPEKPPMEKVDCMLSRWSKWKLCSKTCGSGEQTRSRFIELQSQCGGKECKGALKQARGCSLGCCEENCIWKDWSEWSRCSAICVTGTKKRMRQVDPASVCKGTTCVGESEETQECFEKECPIPCDTKPQENFVKLPSICDLNGEPRFANVGKCERTSCTGREFSFNIWETCCGVVATEISHHDCGSVRVPVEKATRCGCQSCDQQFITVRILAQDLHTQAALARVSVSRGTIVLGKTDEDGMFEFNVTPDTRRITLTCNAANFKRYLPTTKSIHIPRELSSVFATIEVLRQPKPVKINPRARSVISLKSVSNNENEKKENGEIKIEPGMITQSDGTVYTEEVHASVFTVNTFDDEFESFTPGEFKTDDGNKTNPLRNYGLVHINVVDVTGEPLVVTNMELSLPAAGIPDTDLDLVRLWSFNDDTGLWEDEAEMEVFMNEDEEAEHVFLRAVIPIVARHIWSLNVLIERYCYAKVRTYESNTMKYEEQTNEVAIRSLYLDSRGKSQGYSLEYTESMLGACVMVPCENVSHAVQDIMVTATGNDDIKYIASFMHEVYNPPVAGINTNFADLLQYRRNINNNNTARDNSFIATFDDNIKLILSGYGPVYESTDPTDCLLAPYKDQHFAFYRSNLEPSLSDFEYNTVADMFGSSVYSWYTKPEKLGNKVCFIKIAVNSNEDTMIEVSSSVGTATSQLGNVLYGIRRNITIVENNQRIACLEFKCSDELVNGLQEQPLVEVRSPETNCTIESINPQLQMYLLASNPHMDDFDKFQFFAPQDSLGAKFGIFTLNGFDVNAVKNALKSRCHDENAIPAVTFNCFNDYLYL